MKVYDTEKHNPAKKRKQSHEREIDLTPKTPFNLIIANNGINLYVVILNTSKHNEKFKNIINTI